jgi:hypothetical protein
MQRPVVSVLKIHVHAASIKHVCQGRARDIIIRVDDTAKGNTNSLARRPCIYSDAGGFAQDTRPTLKLI